MENNIKVIKNIMGFFLAVTLVYLAKSLSFMLIPLALALFIAVLLSPVLKWLESKKIPQGISWIAITTATTSAIIGFAFIFYQTGLNIAKEKNHLIKQVQLKLDGLINGFYEFFGIRLNLFEMEAILRDYISSDWILNSSGKFAGELGSFFGAFFMTSLYLFALLGGILRYEQYIARLGASQSDSESWLRGFEEIKSSIVSYMKVKFITSFFTGIVFGLLCFVFDIQFWLFWGFLAFILNFVPTIGSILATLPPLLLGLIQLDSYTTLLFLALLLGGTQIIIGNIIEPKMMGQQLALNTISVIFGLVFFGYLWGLAGMVLSVPLLVLLKVILSQSKDAEVIVKLMGGNTKQ